MEILECSTPLTIAALMADQRQALVLLCEHAHRTERFSSAFALAGYLFRQVRVLGLDTPSESNPVEVDALHARELEQRVVWASYCIDVLLASGVDKHSSWRTEVPRIPLPCPNAAFMTKEASHSHFMPILEGRNSWSSISQLDLPALNVVLIYLRTRVLACIRKSPTAVSLQDPASEFMQLLDRLELFYDSLPSRLALSELNLYVLKDNRILGSVLFLHILYQSTVCDLTRIFMPGFNFPLGAAAKEVPADFALQCRRRCCFHAEEITKILRAAQVDGVTALDDPIIADATLESSKIQIIHSAAVSNHINIDATKENIRTNLEVLRDMRLDRQKQSPHVRDSMILDGNDSNCEQIQVLLPICMAFGLSDVAEAWGGGSM